MKIAIVHELVIKLGGAERVLKVLSEMFPQADIYTLLYDQKRCASVFPKNKIKTSSLQKYYQMGVPLSVLRTRMSNAIEEFDFAGYDLVISSSSAFAHGILTDVDTKHICYCHSPMRYVWDYFHEIPKAHDFGWLKTMLFNREANRLRIWEQASADRPDAILANSRTVQKRISKFWGRKANIVFPPVDIDRFQPTDKHEGYFLIVSALQAFKKIDIAVRAFAQMPNQKLVIIGDGDERAHLENIATENVEFLGRKSDAVVSEFMHNCRALIFPGIEDFGIVPIEAMASGKPVIAFAEGGVKETVLDGKTGLFFKEQTPEALVEVLTKFFENKKDFSAKVIRKHSENFSRQRFEEKLMREIKKLFK